MAASRFRQRGIVFVGNRRALFSGKSAPPPPPPPPPPPVCLVKPAISSPSLAAGTPTFAQSGIWQGAVTVTGAWISRALDGTETTLVGTGTEGRFYTTVTPGDIGKTIFFRETGVNAGGSTVADSAPINPLGTNTAKIWQLRFNDSYTGEVGFSEIALTNILGQRINTANAVVRYSDSNVGSDAFATLFDGRFDTGTQSMGVNGRLGVLEFEFPAPVAISAVAMARDPGLEIYGVPKVVSLSCSNDRVTWARPVVNEPMRQDEWPALAYSPHRLYTGRVADVPPQVAPANTVTFSTWRLTVNVRPGNDFGLGELAFVKPDGTLRTPADGSFSPNAYSSGPGCINGDLITWPDSWCFEAYYGDTGVAILSETGTFGGIVLAPQAGSDVWLPRTPIGFTLEGSNDGGSTWTTVMSASNIPTTAYTSGAFTRWDFPAAP